MEIKKINIKIYAKDNSFPALSDFIPVFHDWIKDQKDEKQEQKNSELLIDVADYSHVPAGPGVMLIAHESQYSIGYGAEERFGLTYELKVMHGGSNSDSLNHALKQTLVAAQRLINDERLQNKLEFSGQEFEVIINDRFLGPNKKETFDKLQADFKRVFDVLYSNTKYSCQFIDNDHRERLTVRIITDSSITIETLLKNN